MTTQQFGEWKTNCFRFSEEEETRPMVQDEPGFDRLHYVCQQWVNYLTASDEAEKQKFLHLAVRHLTLLHLRGYEGEEVVGQIWTAINRRERVYAPYFTGARIVAAYAVACGDINHPCFQMFTEE